MKNLMLGLGAVVAMSWSATPCHALTFLLEEVPPGSRFSDWTPAVAADPNCMVPSSNDYRWVIQSAADYWASIYTLPYDITVRWGFAEMDGERGAATNATHFQGTGAGAGLIFRGEIKINAHPADCLYVDYNPNSFWEFPGGTAISEAIPYWRRPGSEVEIGRFTEANSSGQASHRDLYTIMLHEFGHLLGMAWNSWRYGAETEDGDIDVVTWHVNPDLSWLSQDSHITYEGNPNVLMFPRVPAGHRRWPSQADISCLSQISGWWTTSWGSGGGGVTGLAANNPVNM